MASFPSKQRSSAALDLQKRLRSHHNMGRYSDSLMRGLRVLKYDTGSDDRPALMIVSFVVTQDLCNGFDTLHGGAQATAVDIFTSVILHEVNPLPSVTTDLHVSYVSAAPIGSTVICVCRAEKHSSSLHFSSCDLYREIVESDSDHQSKKTRRVLVAKGLHTKYVLKKRTKGFDGEKQRSKL